ncbi:hypothetical protein B7C42_03952 [Nocardia cerradoensis]|uniref:Uncharacterized protein n=1 Tax=Nocardia cerradoensis TaxID=85688 RepID=A0A231H4F4_9NOCA|nr:hypothetical protein B7C42_03952 [Nocardia cerradoensis]
MSGGEVTRRRQVAAGFTSPPPAWGDCLSQWNWPSSVEPFRAAVEVFGSTVVAMVSK